MSQYVDKHIAKTVRLRTSLWQQIEDYRFDARFKTEAAAFRRLLEMGIAAVRAPPQTRDPDRRVPR